MRNESSRRFALLLAVLALNAIVLLQMTGVAYEPFSWKAFAFVYNSENSTSVTPDNDRDAIKPGRDPDDDFFNPSGCFYDSLTGEIVPGGTVVSAPDPADCGGPCHVYIPDPNGPNGADPMDGSDGCYAFLLKGDGGSAPSEPNAISLAITEPPGCAINSLDLDCLPQPGTYSPPPNFNELAEPLGSDPDATRTALDGSFACGDNPWYETIDLSQTNAAGGSPPFIPVINNNLPLLCNVPAGGSCILDPNAPPHCANDFFCAERKIFEDPMGSGICCDRACDAPLEVCDLPGQEGTCITRVAPAPALSRTALAVLLGVLLAVAGLAFRRRRHSVA